MGRDKRIITIKSGDSISLSAALFPSNPSKDESEIIWKKKIHSENDTQHYLFPIKLWSINDDGEDIGTGTVLEYTFQEEDQGKYIKFYAYTKKFEVINQSVVYYVELDYPTEIEILSVSGPDKGYIYNEVDYEVDFSISNQNVSSDIKDSVKWLVEIDENVERLIINEKVLSGYKISFSIPEEWKNKQLFLIPYLDTIDKTICKKTFISEMTPLIIFVNGYWNTRAEIAGGDYHEDYWGSPFLHEAKTYFHSSQTPGFYVNGAEGYFSSGKKRYAKGKELAENRYNNPQSKFHGAVFKYKRKIMVVTHSMGAAYAEGIISFLKSKDYIISKVVHFSPADNSDFEITYPNITCQIDILPDPVLAYKNLNDGNLIKGIKHAILVRNTEDIIYGHYYTKARNYVWDWVKALDNAELKYNGRKKIYDQYAKWFIEKEVYTNHNHTVQFVRITKAGKTFYECETNLYYTY